jgi:predicted SAM-dependent methyltransferase
MAAQPLASLIADHDEEFLRGPDDDVTQLDLARDRRLAPLSPPEFVKAIARPIRRVYRSSALYRWRHLPDTQSVIRQAARPFKLHLGCGDQIMPGWLNIDMEKKGPGIAVMRLPQGLSSFPDQSVAFVYCSHMLEHLAYPGEAMILCQQIRRILAPGGAVRFVVPGIESIIRAYVANDGPFFEEQRKHHPKWCETRLEHLMFALQQDGDHKYGYDFETATKLLHRAGFSHVIDSAHNRSEFPELRVDYRDENLSLFLDAAT